MSSDAVIKRMAERFSLIIDFSAAARITVHYSREDLLLGEIFESKQVTKSEVDLKTTLSLQNGKFFSTVRLKRALKPRKILSVLGNTHTNCSFENVKLTLLLTNNVSKIFSMRELMKFFLGRRCF